jgi:hypothetical protein
MWSSGWILNKSSPFALGLPCFFKCIDRGIAVCTQLKGDGAKLETYAARYR